MPAKKKPAAKKTTKRKAAPKLDPKVAERRDRFARIFPPRVEKLVKSLSSEKAGRDETDQTVFVRSAPLKSR